MPQNQDRNKSLFLAAIEIESSVEREQFLDRECGEKKELKNELLSLLDAHENPPHVMDRLDRMQPTRSHEEYSYVGQQIGPYKLLEVIGEGGMGTVYMAEQTEPVHRRVGDYQFEIEEYRAARRHLEDALSVFRDEYEPNNPYTIETLFDLSKVCRELEEYDEAIATAREVAMLTSTANKTMHGEALRSMGLVVAAMVQARRLEEAEELAL